MNNLRCATLEKACEYALRKLDSEGYLNLVLTDEKTGILVGEDKASENVGPPVPLKNAPSLANHFIITFKRKIPLLEFKITTLSVAVNCRTGAGFIIPG
jgi:hypothetical protein